MRDTSTQPLCSCHDKPVADGATLCQDGTDDLRDLLRWLTTDICRADREPDTETVLVRIPGREELVERTVIVRHGYGRMPSTIWDTPSGEVRNLPRILDESAAKLAVRKGTVIGRVPHAEPPIPLDLRAVDNAGRIRLTIGTYAARLSGQHVPLDAYWDVPTVAAWLIDSLSTIRQQEWAGDMLRDVRTAVTRATRAVDVAPSRAYLGICGITPRRDCQCPDPNPDCEHPTCPRADGHPLAPGGPGNPSPCQGQVFALEGALRGRCGACGAWHDVAERRQQREDQLRGVRLTAAEIEKVTGELGRTIRRNTITKWHERGRLTMDGAGRYSVDAVLILAEQQSARRARKGDTSRAGVDAGQRLGA